MTRLGMLAWDHQQAILEADGMPEKGEVFAALANHRIRQATEAGEFDGLRGAGAPISAQYLGVDTSSVHGLAHKVLANSGDLPAWVAASKEIEKRTDALRAKLAAAAATAATPAATGGVGSRLRRQHDAARDAGEQVAAINKLVSDFNLNAPSASSHKPRLDLRRELRRAGLAESLADMA